MSSPATTPATQPPKTTDAPAPVKKSLFARVLTRPEIGAVAAAIAIFIFFFAIAPPFRTLPSFSTVLYASSTIGIVAVGVALLMIGGEFDLSSGVTVVTAALCAALISFQLSLNMWVGVLVSLIVALGIGFINGYLVVKTRIPSFLITLSTFFMLRGINLGVTKAATGTVATDNVSGLDGFLAAKALFASDIPLGFITVKVTVLWWLLFVAIGTWILLRTRVGNWIFAAGGNADSRPRRRRPGAQGQDRAVHGRGVPGLVLRHAPAVQLLLGAVRARASATSSSTSSPRSSAAACSPAATARSSAPRSARSSSA